MAIFFTPTANNGTGAFIDSARHPQYIVDGVGVGEHVGAVEVTQAQYDALMAENDLGKTLIMGPGDVPIAVDPADLLTSDEKLAGIRERRNRLLQETDWTQLPDTTADTVLWSIYRQVLRNIPQVYADTPDSVIWPTEPE